MAKHLQSRFGYLLRGGCNEHPMPFPQRPPALQLLAMLPGCDDQGGCAHGGGHVDRTAVIRDEKGAAPQEGGKKRQRHLPYQVGSQGADSTFPGIHLYHLFRSTED